MDKMDLNMFGDEFGDDEFEGGTVEFNATNEKYEEEEKEHEKEKSKKVHKRLKQSAGIITLSVD